MTSPDLITLALRVEAATGGDRALDGLAHALTNPDKPWIIGHEPGRFPQKPIYGTLSDFVEWLKEDNGADCADAIGAPFFTASLDAAMGLADDEQITELLQEAIERLGQAGWLPGTYRQRLAQFFTAAALRAHASVQP